MARTRSGFSLVDDSYKKIDLEAFVGRYPRPEVLRYLNQGGAELWDIILKARGRAFGRSPTPWIIPTTVDTVYYETDYPNDFLELLSVRLEGPGGEMLRPLESAEEAWNLEPGIAAEAPSFYELVPGAMRLLPAHRAGLCVIVDYARTFTDLTDASDSLFDGINGWEEYLVCHAAREMALKEGEIEFAREMKGDKQALQLRIEGRAPARDAYRPGRARDVRGEQNAGGRSRRR